nr:MAG TPA: hypothetical protein [Caudoviricetes sp.]
MHNDKDQYLGISIAHLISLCKTKGKLMPSGLSREQRRNWAKRSKNASNP